jgi:hypothetical protein
MINDKLNNHFHQVNQMVIERSRNINQSSDNFRMNRIKQLENVGAHLRVHLKRENVGRGCIALVHLQRVYIVEYSSIENCIPSDMPRSVETNDTNKRYMPSGMYPVHLSTCPLINHSSRQRKTASKVNYK